MVVAYSRSLVFLSIPEARSRGPHSQQFKLTPAMQTLILTDDCLANIVRRFTTLRTHPVSLRLQLPPVPGREPSRFLRRNGL